MENWLPSLNALRAFEAVARHQSYVLAAEELRVTPAAVKQLVRKLEDTLGAKLVERAGRGIAITPLGAAAARDLLLAMHHLGAAAKTLRARADRRRLILTVEASFATTWLVPKLEAFRLRHPGIGVLIDSSQQVVDLETSEADAAIRYGVGRSPGLVVRRLFDDVVLPACSPSLAEGPPRLTEVGQLTEVPLIHWDLAQLPWARETRRWFDWDEWSVRSGGPRLDTSSGLRFSDYGLAVQAATSGRGMIIASWPILKDLFDAGLLVHPFPEIARSTELGYDFVTTPAAFERPELQAFYAWLAETAETHPAETLAQNASGAAGLPAAPTRYPPMRVS
ncbi:MAG: LysR substrate-binding domain-containing protein [Pseudomonadota bacterium]